MDNLIDQVKEQMSDQFLSQLSEHTGGDKKQTKVAAEGAISTLIGALSKNAQDPEKAKNIERALERDHDGSILSNLNDVLLGSQSAQSSKTTDGSGIVKHILGNQSGNVVTMLSKMSGMNDTSSGKVLTTLAPLVMGVLGEQKKSKGLGADDLSSLLNNSVSSKKNDDSNFDLIMKFLDTDGDGSVLDELASIGSSFLGSFFGGKK